jgi:hypothetical protein
MTYPGTVRLTEAHVAITTVSVDVEQLEARRAPEFVITRRRRHWGRSRGRAGSGGAPLGDECAVAVSRFGVEPVIHLQLRVPGLEVLEVDQAVLVDAYRPEVGAAMGTCVAIHDPYHRAERSGVNLASSLRLWAQSALVRIGVGSRTVSLGGGANLPVIVRRRSVTAVREARACPRVRGMLAARPQRRALSHG